MTKLKRFGSSKPRKDPDLGEVRGIGQAASMLDAPISPASGDIRDAPIDEVKPDPLNPRFLNLTWELVQQDPTTIDDPETRKNVEYIQGLAKTLKTIGQRQPCEVVREGSILRIVFGERRYWAARLAELPTLKVSVLLAVPDNVPLVQLIENIHQQPLSFYHTILNIRAVVAREEELGKPIKDATDLMERTGLSRTSAYRYWGFMELPNDVEAALEKRVITSRRELDKLLQFRTVAARRKALERFATQGSFSEPAATEPKPVTLGTRRKGRPRTSVSFGSTKNMQLARFVIEALDTEREFSNVDWDDIEAVTGTWKQLMAKFEQHIRDNA